VTVWPAGNNPPGEQTVTVSRLGPPAQSDFGTTPGAPTTHTEAGCAIQPMSGKLFSADTVSAADQLIVNRWWLLAPDIADIVADDQVTFGSMPAMRVDGAPAIAYDIDGIADHLICSLKLWEGGT
jgi:hypothetical protein